MFEKYVWLGPLLVFILALALRQLRLWLKKRNTARVIARGQAQLRLEQEFRTREAERLKRITRERGEAQQRAVKLCQDPANKNGPAYRISVVDDERVVTEEIPRKYGDPDVVIMPYEPIDGADIRRQKALDEEERKARPRHEHVVRTRTPVTLDEIIGQDKKRAADRDAWIKKEARRLAEESLDPARREELLAEGGQEAVDKLLDESVALALAKLNEGSKKLAGRLLNAENYVPDAERLQAGLMSLGKPLPDAITEPKDGSE